MRVPSPRRSIQLTRVWDALQFGDIFLRGNGDWNVLHHQIGALEETLFLLEKDLATSWMGCKSKEVLKRRPNVPKRKKEGWNTVFLEVVYQQKHEASVEHDQGRLCLDQKGDLNRPKILLGRQAIACEGRPLGKDELGRLLLLKYASSAGRQRSFSMVDGRAPRRKLLSSRKYQNLTRGRFSLAWLHHTYNFARKPLYVQSAGHEGTMWTR